MTLMLPDAQVTYANNTYFSNANPSAWFSINGASNSFAQWVVSAGETGAKALQVQFPDSSRTLETYATSLGGNGTVAFLVTNAALQSQGNWQQAYTAQAVINYLDSGFGITIPVQ